MMIDKIAVIDKYETYIEFPDQAFDIADKILFLPVEGLQVTRECPCPPIYVGDKEELVECPYCKDGKITSPLTLGELAEMARRMVKEIIHTRKSHNDDCFFCALKDKAIDNALTTKSGGVVGLKKEG